jgi:hypothetical protein
MIVGTVPAYPTGIVVSDGDLLVSAHVPAFEEGPSGPDWSTPRGVFGVRPGRGTTPLWTTPWYPRIVAVDADYAYIFDLQLRRARRGAAEVERLPFCNPAWLVIDGDRLFVAWDHLVTWVDRRSRFRGDEESDGVHRLSEDGWGSRVAVDEMHVYYDYRAYADHEAKDCRVACRPKNGGPARILAHVGRHVTALGVVGDTLAIGLARGPILLVSVSGGAPVAVPESDDAIEFATDGERLAWFAPDRASLVVLEGGATRHVALHEGSAPVPWALALARERGEAVAYYGESKPDADGAYPIVALRLG